MKLSKNYVELATAYYRPEMTSCLNCGAGLKRSHTVWHKTISQLSGTRQVYNQGYRCSERERCGQPERVYRSAYADGLSLPYYSYGLDVIVAIGQQRLHEYQTIPEIHRHLQELPQPLRISTCLTPICCYWRVVMASAWPTIARKSRRITGSCWPLMVRNQKKGNRACTCFGMR